MTRPPAWNHLAADRLDGVPSGPALVRKRSLAEYAGPLDLACSLNPRVVRTPALELLSAELERLITVPGTRLIVSFSPQEGKTQSVRHAVLRALQYDPDRRVAIASYAEELARGSSLAIRQMIETHGTDSRDDVTGHTAEDRLGLAIAADQGAAGGWRLHGHEGGVIARGVGSGMTGKPVDLLVCDDPVKDARDADSVTVRSRLYDWWQMVSETRLAPDAPVVVVATRWHEWDLSGWLIDQDKQVASGEREWRVVNIPAYSDGVAADALNRPVGEWMVSARGRTVEQWVKIRRRVGERSFNALYQGNPTPPEGGLFKREWFARDHVDRRPPGPRPPMIVVDPADNKGGGDEAGVGVASVGRDGRIYIGPDYSGHYTAARWSRIALLALVRHEAAGLAYERSLSGVRKIVQDAWDRLWKQAQVLRRLHSGSWPEAPVEESVAAAVAELVHRDDPPDTRADARAELIEMWPHVPGVLRMPSTGPRVQILKPRMAKSMRAEAVQSVYENRRVSHVGDMRVAEHQMATWQVGQPSPDRMDWVTYGIDLMDGGQHFGSIGRANDRVPTSSTSLRSKAGTRLTRSTRR